MKLVHLIVAFGLVALAPGCASKPVPPPVERVVAVKTLQSVGQAAEATVSLSAQLYGRKQISDKQALAVIDFYDRRFQPAFRLAVAAVNSNLAAPATPELLALAAELSSLLASYRTP